QDWRLTKDGRIAGGFGSMMDASMSGRVGNLVTVNGQAQGGQTVRAGERLRLRLANASLARMMALRFEGHRPIVLAIDGQPCDAHEPEDGRLEALDLAVRRDGVEGRIGALGADLDLFRCDR
ncbi:multicopper oxidase family protein, partial [Mesorhizobium sp. M2D.F.Ca.ET.224.01.1.1]